MSKTTDELIQSYLNDGYGFFSKRTHLLLTNEGKISYHGSQLGQFYDVEVEDEIFEKYLMLAMEDSVYDKLYNKYKRELAQSANKYGVRVVFTNTIDILGFGIKHIDPMVSLEEVTEQLINVAKNSQDDDIKTACIVVVNNGACYLSYNQEIDTIMMHAEDILSDFESIVSAEFDTYSDIIKSQVISNFISPRIISIYSLLEPCANCLHHLIYAFTPYRIEYGQLHKEKWNTPEYIQLTNNIFAKRTSLKHYDYRPNKKVEKFYKRRTK